ncbi:MAG: right-handed parallel beta-helix repeat-containing protein [Planctomycetes bacterium]|nr:right-handed parallel beta-helix repeat-containing protein [Planctomycetota bacterium]
MSRTAAVLAAAWIAAAIPGASRPLVAGEYHVALAGSDLAGDGTATNPWQTITHALRTIPAPTPAETHTIHVGPGYWLPGGTETFPLDVPQGVILRGAGIDLTVLSEVLPNTRQPPAAQSAVVVRLQNGPAGPRIGVAPAELTHLSIAFARVGVEVIGDTANVPEPLIHGVKFAQNHIGIQVTNAAPKVEQCLFDANTMGISAGRITTTGGDMEFRRNFFWRNTYGISAANTQGMLVEQNRFEQNHTGILMGAVGSITTSPVLRNNVYFRNGQGYSASAMLGAMLTPQLVHETFHGNGTGISSMDDIYFGGRSDPDIRNCIIWGSLIHDLNGVSQNEIRHSNLSTAVGVPVGPIIGVNGILAVDPGFVDAGGGDFHLSDRSPLIDKGTMDVRAMPAADLDGKPRTIGYPDLGAHEFASFLVHNRAACQPRELRLVLTARQDALRVYVLAASLVSDPLGGIAIGNRRVPLLPDGMFFDTIGFNGRIPGFLGPMNGGGQAQVRIFVADWPWIRGWTVHLAYITLDPTCPHGIKTVSNVVSVAVDTL